MTSMQSDLKVSAIGIGAWSWGDRSGYWGYGKGYDKDDTRKTYEVSGVCRILPKIIHLREGVSMVGSLSYMQTIYVHRLLSMQESTSSTLPRCTDSACPKR